MTQVENALWLVHLILLVCMYVGHDATMNYSSGTSSSKHCSSHSVVPSDPIMTEVAAMSSQTATRNPEAYRPRCAVSCDL
jgi:hypothetical protein